MLACKTAQTGDIRVIVVQILVLAVLEHTRTAKSWVKKKENYAIFFLPPNFHTAYYADTINIVDTFATLKEQIFGVLKHPPAII